MGERGDRTRLALEASAPIWIERHAGGEHLDGDVAGPIAYRGRDTLRPCRRAPAMRGLRTVRGEFPSRATSGPAIIPARRHASLSPSSRFGARGSRV